MVTARHVSAQDVPRVDWGTLINRSQELSRLDPDLTLSDAIWRAALEYENGYPPGSSPSERRLVEVARIHPERLMKTARGRDERSIFLRDCLGSFWWLLIGFGLFYVSIPWWTTDPSNATAQITCWVLALICFTFSGVGRHLHRTGKHL